MKVIAWGTTDLKESIAGKKDTVRKFESVEEASRFFNISTKRILNCIKTGRKWRGVTFDEGF